MNTIDNTAWLTLQKELHTFVLRRVRDKSLTDDIVQDVLLKVHTHITSLKEPQKINAWAYQITRNAIADHFRKQSKQIDPTDANEDGPEPNYNECVSLCTQEMLNTLPLKYREAIELTVFKDLSQLQLAERVHISYSGAKSRVQRAKEMLRKKMDEAYRIQTDSYGNAINCESPLPCGCE